METLESYFPKEVDHQHRGARSGLGGSKPGLAGRSAKEAQKQDNRGKKKI